MLADPLVLALFGPRWSEAAPVIQLLGIAYLGSPISQVTGSAYKAIKRVDVLIKLGALQLPLLVGLLAIFVDDGIVAIAGCQAGVRVLFSAIGVFVATRELGLRACELWNAAWPASSRAPAWRRARPAGARDHVTLAGGGGRLHGGRRGLPRVDPATRARAAAQPVGAGSRKRRARRRARGLNARPRRARHPETTRWPR